MQSKAFSFQLLFGRDDGIWTHSLCVPNATLYQIEPHLDIKFFGFKNNSLCGQICGQSHFFAFLENFKSALKQGVSTGLTIWGFIFEPLEPYSRTRRSTKLSHTPILNITIFQAIELYIILFSKSSILRCFLRKE